MYVSPNVPEDKHVPYETINHPVGVGMMFLVTDMSVVVGSDNDDVSYYYYYCCCYFCCCFLNEIT